MITLVLRAGADLPAATVERLEDIRAAGVATWLGSLLSRPYVEHPERVAVESSGAETGLIVGLSDVNLAVSSLDVLVALCRLDRRAAEAIGGGGDWSSFQDVDPATMNSALERAIADAVKRGAGSLCTDAAIARTVVEAKRFEGPRSSLVKAGILPALVDRGVMVRHMRDIHTFHRRRESTSAVMEWAYARLRCRPPTCVRLALPPPDLDVASPETLEGMVADELGYAPPIRLERASDLPPGVLEVLLNEQISYYFQTGEAWETNAVAGMCLVVARARPEILFSVEDAATLLSAASQEFGYPRLVNAVLDAYPLVDLTLKLRQQLVDLGSLRSLVPLLEEMLAS